jgi:hypothetical protein
VAPLLAGLAVAAGIVGLIVYMQWGAHVELRGALLKVRTQEMDQTSSVAVVDFRFAHPSDYPFIVRRVDVLVTGKDGKVLEGQTIADSDAQRLFQYYPLLGQRFNESLRMRDRIDARQSSDRMVAARFEAPVNVLEERKQLIVRIEDVDGPVSELREK